MLSRVVAALLAATLASCAPAPRPAPEAVRAASSPESARARYEALARNGQPVFRVDAARSLVTIEVRRGGSLASFGHDHVVASRSVEGFVAPAAGDADLSVPLWTLTVDEPALRDAAGLDTQPSPSDIEGTRANMLDKVLHADEQSVASVRLRGVRDAAGHIAIEPSVTLNGTTRVVKAEVHVASESDLIRVTGRLPILQTDFGLVPFSALGGAIRVQDALEVRFDIVARPFVP